MEFKEILKRRTIRFFKQQSLAKEDFNAMLEAARQASCASNKQRLRYIVVQTKELVDAILPHTAYGGLVTPRRNPEINKTAPAAFLVMLAEDTSGKHIYADAGAAVQSIQFAAWERGIGCCWLGSFKPEKVAELLNLKDPAKIIYLIAVGYPAENPVTEDIDADGNPAYYLDDNDTLHVPKFTVDAITEWM